jgi:hypothetical protein
MGCRAILLLFRMMVISILQVKIPFELWIQLYFTTLPPNINFLHHTLVVILVKLGCKINEWLIF